MSKAESHGEKKISNTKVSVPWDTRKTYIQNRYLYNFWDKTEEVYLIINYDINVFWYYDKNNDRI